MKILLFTQFLLSSALWCQTLEFEYFNGGIAPCIECESDLECSMGRQCWADTWCKTDILCGDEDDNECNPLPSPVSDCDSGCPNDERCACYASMSGCATTGYWNHCGCGLDDQPCCGGCSPCGLTVQAVCSSQPSPPPPLPSPPPPILVPLHQYLSPYPPPSPYLAPPPPSPYLSPPPLPSPSDDMILKYFKEIGLPLLIAIIGLIGSMVGRKAVKHRTKSKRRKRSQIQLSSIQSALDDDNLSSDSESYSNKTIEIERV
jgi:hypothetical protein